MNTVDEYLNKVTPSQKVELQRVRAIVKQVVPEAEEVISYGMPTFKYKGQQILNYAAFKNHMSLFGDIAPFEKKLDGYNLSHRGTVQFTEAKPLPEDIIKQIILYRVSRVDGGQTTS